MRFQTNNPSPLQIANPAWGRVLRKGYVRSNSCVLRSLTNKEISCHVSLRTQCETIVPCNMRAYVDGIAHNASDENYSGGTSHPALHNNCNDLSWLMI